MVENFAQLLKNPRFLITFTIAILIILYNFLAGSKILAIIFLFIITFFVLINFYKTNSHK